MVCHIFLAVSKSSLFLMRNPGNLENVMRKSSFFNSWHSQSLCCRKNMIFKNLEEEKWMCYQNDSCKCQKSWSFASWVLLFWQLLKNVDQRNVFGRQNRDFLKWFIQKVPQTTPYRMVSTIILAFLPKCKKSLKTQGRRKVFEKRRAFWRLTKTNPRFAETNPYQYAYLYYWTIFLCLIITTRDGLFLWYLATPQKRRLAQCFWTSMSWKKCHKPLRTEWFRQPF